MSTSILDGWMRQRQGRRKEFFFPLSTTFSFPLSVQVRNGEEAFGVKEASAPPCLLCLAGWVSVG